MSRPDNSFRTAPSPYKTIALILGLALGAAVVFASVRADTSNDRPLTTVSPGPTSTSTNTATYTPTPTATLPPCPPERVIWDQMSSSGTGATASQDFEVSLDSFDSYGSDDFQVGSGEVAIINKIVVRGKYFNGPGPVESFSVGFDGQLLTGLSYTQNGDEFTIPLPPSRPLNRGIYPVSVQAKMNFGSGGQWAWLDRDEQFFGFPAQWQNAGGGYGIPQCTAHNDKRGEVCGIDPGFPEQAFRVEGHDGLSPPCAGTPAASPTPTSTHSATPTATVSLTPTPTATPTFPQCGAQQVNVLSSNFDNVAPPTLPSEWIATNPIDPDGVLWQTSSTGLPSPPSYSAPNAAWINDPSVVSDKYLQSSTFFIYEASWGQLRFRHNFNLESGLDGGVLEVSSSFINGGAFIDVTDPAVGGTFVTGGYNSTITAGTDSPIAGRQAWSGNSTGFVTTIVNLPSYLPNGKLRWRMASDNSGSGEGWRIDDITVTECHFSGTPTATATATLPPTSTPTASPSPIHVSLGVLTFVTQGSLITVPISVGDMTGRGITSYDLQVTYLPSGGLTPWQSGFDQTGTLSSGMTVTSNTSNQGHLIISASQATDLSGSGTLLNLKFLVDHSPGTYHLDFADYTDPQNVSHPGFRFNNGTPPATTTNGAVVIMNTPTPTATNTFTPTPTATNTFTPTTTATSTRTSTPLPVCSPLLLWDQINGGTGTNGTASQDFETASDAFDAEVADDFQLGSGASVVISKVIARGIYFNGSGPAASFNVRFYGGASSLPGALIREFTGLTYTQDGDKFIINIPNFSTFNLSGWVSVQARMDFSPGGQWAWLDREQYQFMGPSTWRNPGGGYSIPQCVNFAQRGPTCNIDPAYTDQAFQIIGYRPAGACTVPPAASISGTVTYGNAIPPATRFVSNVLLSGMGSAPVSITTAFPDGGYTLSGFGAGSYTVTPSKTGGVNNISSFDAARVAQHVAAINVLTGNQLIVADTSGNGTISSFDAGQIARYAAALSGFGTTGNWIFSPVNRSYAFVTSNVTGEDYSALLMGEVSGNWTNSGPRPAAGSVGRKRSAVGIEVELPNSISPVGKEMVVPVSVQGTANKGIISYEFNLRYDPSVIQPVGDAVDLKDSVSRGLVAVTNAAEPGFLRVVVYGPLPIDQDGVLLNLRFAAVGAAGSVSPISFERIMFNEGEPRVGVAAGRVELF